MEESREITGLLHAWRSGDATALDKIIPCVYAELHRLAHSYLSREQSRDVLQTTALVHEAYLRLVRASEIDWKSRIHFFAISATLMRRILVEFARTRRAVKRGGNEHRDVFDEDVPMAVPVQEDLVAIDEALTALSEIDPREARVVELRFFSGMTVEETSAELGISPDTVLRDWMHAKVWLLRKLSLETRRGG
ncbi:MAG: sigma-70 family RNA polymerase sigma factor, partial [Bryobacteraceae bacterium]|nr:sigma-70 family RNA polymerase sigma factor [Bryobacteraceae bacterium]